MNVIVKRKISIYENSLDFFFWWEKGREKGKGESVQTEKYGKQKCGNINKVQNQIFAKIVITLNTF